jgi:hypothetical protein
MYAEGGCIKLLILLDTPPLLELSVSALPANKNLFLFFFLFV